MELVAHKAQIFGCYLYSLPVTVGRVNKRGNHFLEILKKRVCLNARFMCIETRRRTNREDPSTLT